ncbi:ComF family protein [Candidatus Dependentiae bacterium]|nr:ComF family protein [Candidatus Dependentiae bacterium]
MAGALKQVRQFINSALQVIYPSLCRTCDRIILPQSVFCTACIQEIKPIVSTFLPITSGMSMPVFAAGSYQGPLKALVLRKFNGDMLASKQLAHVMLATMPFDVINADLVIPVPLHWWRYAQRGYNQAVIMAKEIGKELKVPAYSMLVRSKRTSFQSRLDPEERRQNVFDAFALHPWHQFKGISNVQGKHVILVDDLCTTGATLMSAAKTLLPLKPASITAVVACRAV